MPDVDVVILTYNREDCVQEAADWSADVNGRRLGGVTRDDVKIGVLDGDAWRLEMVFAIGDCSL